MKSKKTLSILLAAMLVASMGTSAFADEKTAFDKITVSATMKVETPVISFDVPTGADIALDSYQLADETGSQIYSASYGILNMSNIPIRAVVKPQIKIGSGVDLTVVGTAAEAKPTNAEDQDKKVYMQITPSDKIETTATTDDTPTTPANGDTPGVAALKQKEYAKGAYTAASTAKAVVSTQANGNITFALAPAKYVDNTAASAKIFDSLGAESTTIKGAGQFRFMGTLNPNVTYADDDIGVDIVFDVAGLTKDDYATLSAKPVANAANVASITNGTFGPFVVTESSDITSNAAFDIQLDMGSGKDAATSVTAVKAGTATLAKNTEWTFDPDTKKLSITQAGATKAEGTTLTITMDKGNPKTLTIEIPAAA